MIAVGYMALLGRSRWVGSNIISSRVWRYLSLALEGAELIIWDGAECVELRLEVDGLACMWYISSAASPTELSVRITRFPVSLEVWDDKDDDECRTEPSKFSGLCR